MSSELHLYISEEGADAERLDALSRYLRDELAELDVDKVEPLSAGLAPPGARAGMITDLGGLLVTMGQSADALASVISAITAWLRRGKPADRSVRLEIEGDLLELSQASANDQELLVQLFINRHQSAESN